MTLDLAKISQTQYKKHKIEKKKKKINQWDFLKIKNFCSPKATVMKNKRQARDWEKICANMLPAKDSSLDYVKSSNDSPIRRQISEFFKMGKKCEQTIHQRYTDVN